jgi:hypothetical protein
MTQMTMTITINGSATNPWEAYGLRANPFPQIGKAELTNADRIIRSLDSDPIRDEADLRERLNGCTPEFIEGCVARYRPGERVRFNITFPYP